MRRIAIGLLVALAAAVAVSQADAAPACTITWDGPAAGSWDTAANWDLNRLPASTDHACVPAGSTVTHSSGDATVLTVQVAGALKLTGGSLTLTSTSDDSNATQFDMAGGVLGGAGTLSVSSASTWSGGRMAGPGKTVVKAGATLVHTGTPGLSDGRVLENAGTIDLSQSSSYINDTGADGSQIHNLVGGVIKRTAVGTGLVTLYPPVENDGTLIANAGILELRGGGASSSGDYGASAAGGTVRFTSGTFSLADGAGLLGGTDVRGATLDLASGATATASGTNAFASGTLSGSGTLAITGTLDWSGGAMRGTGTTKVLAGATLAHSGTPALGDGWLLENAGTIDLRADASYINDTGTDGSRIHNLAGGAIKRSATGTGVITLYPPVENDGTITSPTGRLELSGGGSGTSTGAFGAAGAAGSVRFVAGAFTLGQGAQLLDGATIADSTVITIPAGATVTAKGAPAMSDGKVQGAGTLAITGAGTVFAWSGGSMGEDGVTTVATGAKLAVRSFPVTVSGSRRIDVSGTLELESDVVGSLDTGLVHVLSGGVMRKTGGVRESFVSVPVRNDGTVDGLAGEIQLARGSSVPDTGVFKGASATKHVTFIGQDHKLAGSAQLRDFTEIAGTVTVTAGQKLTIADDITQTGNSRLVGDVDVSGSIGWSGGRQEGGTTTILPAGKVVVERGDSVFSCGSAGLGDDRTLVNQGVLRIQDGSDLSAFGDQRATIESTGRIEIATPAATDCGMGGIVGDVLVHNTGTIEKTGPTAGLISGTVDNDGTVVSSAGELQLDSGSTVGQSGTFRATATGATVSLIEGIVVLDPGAAFDGTVALDEGVELRIPGGMTLAVPAGDTLLQRSGTVSGAGTLQIGGKLVLGNADMEGPGSTVLTAGSTTSATETEDDSASLSLRGDRAMVNGGTMTFDGARLSLDDGASLLNTGTLEVKGETTLDGDGFDQQYSSLLHNTGTLRKTGTSRIEAALPIDNDGAIEVTGGTLAMTNIVNWTGFPFTAAGLVGGDYVVDSGTLVVPAAMKVLGARLALDGAASKVVFEEFTGTTREQIDALAPLRRIAGSGELALSGGRSLTVASDPDERDPFVNAGILRLGSGSKLTAPTGFRQTAGGLLQTGVNGATVGSVAATGSAELGGRLHVVSVTRPAGDVSILTAGTVTGTFGEVTSRDATGYDVVYEPGAVKLRNPSGGGRTTPAGSGAPAGADVTVTGPAQGGAAAPAGEDAAALAGTLRLDDRALRVRGPWARRGGLSVAHRRGATLVRRDVTARTIAIVAATGPRSGAVKVLWRGRVLRTVSLRTAKPGRRTLRIAGFTRVEQGTLRLRTTSAKRVAIDALLVAR